MLDYVKKRVANKVKGWSGKPVNLAGKDVLAKSVLLTMPTDVMACVKLPTEDESFSDEELRGGSSVTGTQRYDMGTTIGVRVSYSY
ncbi:hypothetical protein RHSIM_Rhsim10G0036700 [Rhododendron simsii]|uniref:Uncharacterized protein n=1 Tax=Rhododendron simsii TaxID=118357 RepID=A0A834GED7_RHOSS|nr:hypothetical protein RHSIM_Rhsim10G0036700 [Rhododendron simsii]